MAQNISDSEGVKKFQEGIFLLLLSLLSLPTPCPYIKMRPQNSLTDVRGLPGFSPEMQTSPQGHPVSPGLNPVEPPAIHLFQLVSLS